MRTAPVQGAKPISWETHLLAWEAYDRKWRCGQTAERIAQRGGFAVSEMDEFVPDWRERENQPLQRGQGG